MRGPSYYASAGSALAGEYGAPGPGNVTLSGERKLDLCVLRPERLRQQPGELPRPVVQAGRAVPVAPIQLTAPRRSGQGSFATRRTCRCTAKK